VFIESSQNCGDISVSNEFLIFSTRVNSNAEIMV